MCSRGVYQLRNVKLQYCDWGGSSVGVRELLAKSELDTFLEKNPSINFTALVRTGAFPCFHTEYINGWKCSIPLRNLNADEIMEMLNKARSQFGQRALPHSGPKVTTANPSIQGMWKPNMWGTIQTLEEEVIRELPTNPIQLRPRKQRSKPDFEEVVEGLMKKRLF